jgi:hypothetical protein
MTKALLLVAGLAAAAAPAAAQSPGTARADIAQFDVAKAGNVAETLVICDRAELLSSGLPSQNVTRAFVRVDDTRYDLALPPNFARASGWYDQDVEDAYRRLRNRGQVDQAQVQAAQDKYRTPWFSGADRLSVADRRFLRTQVVACEATLDTITRG